MLDISVTRKQFDDKLVLHNCRFSVQQGELVALVGPSGCGKSTLVKLIAGLDDNYVGEIHQSAAKQAIGYVFQSPRLLPWRTALENVQLAGEGISEEAARKHIDAVGLAGEEGNYPGRMSGGMQRRLAIARAFAIDPGLLLLDEPFVSLDEPSAGELRILLLDLLSARQGTTIFITHDLHEAAALADRIIFLSKSPAGVIAEITPDGCRGKRRRQEIDDCLERAKECLTKEIREQL